MKKIYDLDEWKFDKKIPGNMLIASVTIYLKYIDLKKVIQLTPKERIIAIDKHLRNNLQKLLRTTSFDTYKLIGHKRRPRGVKTTITINEIKRLARYSFIESIFINSAKGGKKTIKTEPARFFCIKMTVAIQIEGLKNRLQTYEERYVLIKAKTSDEAYRKIERQRKKYEQPYLNSQGQLVRWAVESLDDCYVTDIVSYDDLNNPEGAEVFSVLKKRKLTKDRFWNGKLK
jgi:hypothetical protein